MNHDILFEVLPPSKSASEDYVQKFLDRIINTINEMKDVIAINIPNIVEENHVGLPYYRNIDNRKFGVALREHCRKDVILNNVVVHFNPKEKFEEWLHESIKDYGIGNFVFVGAKLDSIKYPGPSVIEANSIAKGEGINFGNIFIQEREHEADRLINKTVSGCNFFTSQVLFEPESIINVLGQYSIKCREANLKPAKFFLSFAPVSSLEDIDFIKWLGAEIKEKTENRLKNAKNIGEESINVIIETLNKISDFFDKKKLKIHIGLNIEYISLHNLELARNLVHSVSELKITRW